SPFQDPLPLDMLTQQQTMRGAEAVSPVPPETTELAAALLGTGLEPTSPARLDALRERLDRVVADARAKGRLALLSDAYFGTLARRFRTSREGEPSSEAAAEAVERALPYTTPVDAAEELVAA